MIALIPGSIIADMISCIVVEVFYRQFEKSTREMTADRMIIQMPFVKKKAQTLW